MNTSRVNIYCPECRKKVAFSTQKEERNGLVKGENYLYNRLVARCEDCNEELDVYNDENLKILYDAFRSAHDIISLEKIREIPEKYNIGKRVLSLLLGWGEQTFSRYCDGYLPTKQYSDVLKKLYDDPNIYRKILEEGKNAITDVAYRKSKRAIQALLLVEPTNIIKVYAYLRQKKDDLSNLRLQKLLYYIQGTSFAFMDNPIFNDRCEAWAHGPVFRNIYQHYKNESFAPEFGDLLSNDEKKFVDGVLCVFGRYDGDTLAEFTHSEPPWLETRGELAPNERSEKEIPLELISSYFIGLKVKHKMSIVTDMKIYVNDLLDALNMP